MRIFNEDNEQLLHDHEKANKLLTASAAERDENAEQLKARDEKRNPLKKDQMDALLTKGTTDDNILNQIVVMVHKRFHQFTRSKGQWALGFVFPLLVAVAVGSILNGMSSTIVSSDPGATFPTFDNQGYATPLSGPASQDITTALFANAFGANSTTLYLGQTYDEMSSYISEIATDGVGATSTAGVYYESISNFTVMYNASYPINFVGAVSHLLKAATQNATNNLLQATNSFQSLPSSMLFAQLNDGILVALLVAIFAGSLGAGMSIVISGERVQLVKHQQLASGASLLAYWVANFLFDYIVMFLLSLVFTILLVIFQPADYSGSGFGAVIVGAIFFSAASVFRFYCVSFLVADVRMAQTIYFYGSLFVMFVIVTQFNMILMIVEDGNASTVGMRGMIVFLTLIEPAFGWFIIIVYQHNFLGVITQNGGDDVLTEIAGPAFFSLIAASFIYIFILYLSEGGGAQLREKIGAQFACLVCCKTKEGTHDAVMQDSEANNSQLSRLESDHCKVIPVRSFSAAHSIPSLRIVGAVDPDVQAEREKVAAIVSAGDLSTEESAIFISALKKVYYGRGSVPAKVAVKDVSMSIQRGEVFGLLGANGAGKTTLLKMVSGQELPSSGFAFINGYDVVRNTAEAQRSMGLCPQFDTLVERLTVKENILFFGQIKGLSGATLVEVCEAFMAAMNIKRYQNKLIQQLSGGNRRKVSLTVALLGAPPTVYLDEPSTGLDPVASRLMWRLLSKISAMKTTAIVLTTHNMLECEAVCTRICIMKLGEMVCLGDSQHLRSTHGTGFLLEVTLASPDSVARAKEFVASTFPHASVVDEHVTMINFEIPKSSIARLSQAFGQLELQKTELGIIDYALSQSTLEQVFLKQIRPRDSDARQDADQRNVTRVPTQFDMWFGYSMWAMALFIPGLHHFYLGNTARGVKYLLTVNEAMAGWLLDGFEMHVLIQASVQEYGHSTGFSKWRLLPAGVEDVLIPHVRREEF